MYCPFSNLTDAAVISAFQTRASRLLPTAGAGIGKINVQIGHIRQVGYQPCSQVLSLPKTVAGLKGWNGQGLGGIFHLPHAELINRAQGQKL